MREIEERRMLALLRERDKLKRENGLSFYRPHKKQLGFHSAAHFKYRFVRTGNRWGKSQCGTAEDLSFCIGERLFLPEDDPARSVGIPKRSVKGLIIVYDWDKAEEIFTNMTEGEEKGKIFQLLPKEHFVGVEKNGQGKICKVLIKSKWGGISTLHIDTVKSFLQNPMGQESSHWDFIHVDEPCPREMWIANSRGLMDKGGKAWFLCTPISEVWINDFFMPSRRLKIDESGGSSFGSVDKNYEKKWIMIGSSYDNPFVPDEEKNEFACSLTKEEAECRLMGRPTALAGMVYREYEPEEHNWNEDYPPHGWKSMEDVPKDYTIRYAIDPHPKTPHAVLFAATAPTGEVFFYAEIFEQCLIEDLCMKIHDVIGERHVELALCDPLAYTENPVDGMTMADVMVDYGLDIVKAPKDLVRGIQEVRQALKQKMPNGKPWLRFMPQLAEVYYEFDHYVWDQKRLNKPVDKDDHMMECLYRLVISGLDYVKPPDPKEQKFYPQYNPVGLNFKSGEDYTSSLERNADVVSRQSF